MAWRATWGTSEKCWTCRAPTNSWRGRPQQCRTLNWWSNADCRACGTAPKPRNRPNESAQGNGSSQQAGGGGKRTSYALAAKPKPPWKHDDNAAEAQPFLESKAAKKARRKQKREEKRKSEAATQSAGPKEPDTATEAVPAPTAETGEAAMDTDEETTLPLKWNIDLVAHFAGNTRPKGAQKELQSADEQLANLMPEGAAAADAARLEEAELTEIRQLLTGDHHPLAKAAFQKRRDVIEQDLVLKRTERASRLAGHAAKNAQRKQACGAEVEGHITRLKQQLELFEKECDEAIAEWPVHNKKYDDRSDELLCLVSTKVAAYRQQPEQKQPLLKGEDAAQCTPTVVPGQQPPIESALATAAQGATLGLAQQHAQGGDPAAVAALELFAKRVVVDPATLTSVATINPDSTGQEQLAKLMAWHQGHSGVIMLSPSQLIYTYQHMDVMPTVVQQLVGDAVWKSFYGEEEVKGTTVVPLQLKEIMVHQLGLLSDDLGGNQLEAIRKQSDKRARDLCEEIVRHTAQLERAARRSSNQQRPY